MASITASRPSTFLPSRLSRPRLPPFSPLALRQAPQEPPSLSLVQSKNAGLGLADPWRRTRRRGPRKREAKGEDASGPEGKRNLEEELCKFMETSEKPDFFPTREQLLAAGRKDLADAIAAEGGWLAYGWNLEEERGDGGNLDSLRSLDSSNKDSLQEDERMSQPRFSSEANDGGLPRSGDSCTASSSGRSMETEGGEDGGIEGILRRLEVERSLAFGMGSSKKGVNGRGSFGPGDSISFGHETKVGGSEMTSRSGGVHLQNGTSADVDGKISSKPDTWRSWSLQRAGNPAIKFEDHDRSNEVSMDSKMQLTKSAPRTGTARNESHTDQNQIRVRLQHLESDLTSALHLLRSRTKEKGQQSSVEGLYQLSDAWEFQETEIMKARDKLRSIRAKLAVLEGKMALELIEARKIMEEKQKRLNAAENALHLLRTTCIVWPNSAKEVLLAGSFDGWTSQRRMEQSSSGFFSLHLKLYPGRYEIKFIVDGVWKIDPLRPIVHNNGHENNLLIIP
ncbi:protein FLOURY ENDOSPERM 6, chloroplastic isoform X2 [Phoenix dactylifera]|uniref:Protein FLOURY ENDOSPERM 6, chloroplastic isoform X2 n=1 Tax=Phoenix dactylifera TaxID=42345 RepID=A0A8B7CWE7_PHODC|nr:protein FLOURY ENDOSPERM 6, chloroplastic isoform X2 [Phoenix dactylifera]